MKAQTFEDTILVSDIHGFLDEFQFVLQKQELLDENNRWIGGDSKRLILMGDFVDRGPKSVETYVFFRALQGQLSKEQITLLFGNHDIQYFGGPLAEIEKDVETQISGQMRHDAIEGKLQAATTVKVGEQEFLVVHGGLHPGHNLNGLGVEGAAEHLNNLGRDFAKNNTQHPEIVAVGLTRAPDLYRQIGQAISEADISDQRRLSLLQEEPTLQMLKELNKEGVLTHRGKKVLTAAAMYGISDTPGITWCDVQDDLGHCNPEALLPQIVGHRQQRDGINLRCAGKVWAVNVPYGDAQALNVKESGITLSSRYHAGLQGFEPELEPELEGTDHMPTFGEEFGL